MKTRNINGFSLIDLCSLKKKNAILFNFYFRFLSLFQNFRLFLAILTNIWPFFTGRHPELSSPSHLSHPSQQAGNNRNLGLFSHFYDGQRQQSHFPRTSGEFFFFTKVFLEFCSFTNNLICKCTKSATISILANIVRTFFDRKSYDTAFGSGTFSWQDPVHSWKAGPGEVMTGENIILF